MSQSEVVKQPPVLSSFDILIVGGGIVGNALALALADQPLNIGIIEAQAPSHMNAERAPARGTAAIALTYASVSLFQSLNIWEKIASQATPIRQVHVSEAGRFGRVQFKASDVGFPFLGQVVSSDILIEALQTQVLQLPSITTFYESQLKHIECHAEGYSLNVEQSGQSKTMSARLLVGADGTQSFTRKLLNISVKSKNHQQHALVATLQLSKPHQGIAYERFTVSGPLAALPISVDRCVVVWTVPQCEANAVMALSDAEFCEKLQKLWGYKLGRILSTEKRQSFPLQSVFAEQQVVQHAMLLGNSAHTLHPVAAQGLNLSLKDLAVFEEMVSKAISQQQDPLEYALLQAYAQCRKKEQALISGFTNTLVQLFSNGVLPLVWARNIGLSSLNLLPAAQKVFSKKAMGLLGRLPKLMQY